MAKSVGIARNGIPVSIFVAPGVGVIVSSLIFQEKEGSEKLSRVYIKNRYEKNPANTMRVTRPSRWGNPFTLEKYSREKSLRLYELWLIKQIDVDHEFLEPLRNKNLACFCKLDEKCHADILLKFLYEVEWLAGPSDTREKTIYLSGEGAKRFLELIGETEILEGK